MKKLSSLWGVILLTVAFLCFPPPTVGAESDVGGSGDGSGGGANSGQALRLTASSVADGQKDVPPDAVIDLEFSNNVVNISVAENNRDCFVLRDDQGSIAPAAVVIGDEQTDPTIKRNISIVPAAPLEPGTVYTLLIKQNLSAKNGNTLAGDVAITFTTAGTKAVAAPTGQEAGEAVAETNSPESEAGETQAAAGADAAESIKTGEEAITATEALNEGENPPSGAKKARLQSTKLTYGVVAIGLALAVCFVIYFRKR